MAIVENGATGVHYGGTSGVEPPFDPVRLDDLSSLDAETARAGQTSCIDDLAADRRFDATAICERYGWTGGANKSLLNIPLTDQMDEIVGILQLVNARLANGQVAASTASSSPALTSSIWDFCPITASTAKNFLPIPFSMAWPMDLNWCRI